MQITAQPYHSPELNAVTDLAVVQFAQPKKNETLFVGLKGGAVNANDVR
ncbi:MAG: hypothetical protein Q9N32_01165 [Gammaproteobacteria bacterium]|nr:hypothetical protein [Gammaproteobacteria bacterium]